MRKNILTITLTAGLGLATGCAGQLKAAMLDHAKSTRAIADTLSKSTAAMQCEGTKSPDTCTAAVGSINDQAKALHDSAKRLEDAAK